MIRVFGSSTNTSLQGEFGDRLLISALGKKHGEGLAKFCIARTNITNKYIKSYRLFIKLLDTALVLNVAFFFGKKVENLKIF